jgi:SAM-dependent methyltransferase
MERIKMTQAPASRTSRYWDDRFSEPGFAYGESPNEFLRTSCRNLAPGDALSLCEGEGRNAVYLAKRGFRVTAVDFSRVGLAKAEALAARHGVTITTVFADIADFDLGVGRWDLVAAIFAQPEGAVRRRLYGQLSQSLRREGAFILESKTGPEAGDADRYPGADILAGEIAPLKVAFAEEKEQDMHEGRYHSGLLRTVRILAFNR